METEILPDNSRIVSVCGIFFYNEKIILVRNKRGWEIPGGHREEGESVEETLVREIQEEVGISPTQYSYTFYGYREVTPLGPMFNETLKKPYPVPYYMAHYIGIITDPTLYATGDDVFERKFFTMDEVKQNEIRATELIMHAYEYKNKC